MNNIIIFFLASLMTAGAFAGTVTQAKGNKVLIDFSGESVSVGERYFLLNSSNKKAAIIQITQVKNQKALGTVQKGKAGAGFSTQLIGGGSSGGGSSASSSSSGPIRLDQMRISGQFKYLMNKISAKQQDTLSNQETVAMTGSNFALYGVGEMPMSFFTLRASAGYEILDVKGTGLYLSCAGRTSTDCNVQVNYLGLGAMARFDITKSSFNSWAGAGFTMKYPMTKKSTALDVGGLSFANTIVAALGVDYYFSNKSFFPISFEYHLSTNKSDTVPIIDQMGLSLGYGMVF
jgi:hypothetical protein